MEEGLGEFLPPQALKVVAEEYQQGLLDRLNEEVAGTGLRGKTVAQTVIDAAQDPSKILIYNYASEALNNSFFLSCLSPLPEGETSHEERIAPDLAQAINTDFGNLEQLKSTFSAAVAGMLCQGWVWLLVDQAGHLAVYPTFGNGTLLVRASEFLPTKAGVASPLVVGEEQPAAETSRFGVPSFASSPTSGVSHSQGPHRPPTQARSLSTGSSYRGASVWVDKSEVARTGDRLFPLLCVSVHEHAWLSAGYGVWGKEEWIKKFWAVVNWEQASMHFTRYNMARLTRRN
ncbi:manganese and iron superoxide dismutase [Trametopsis cervina]|nr:manganese and iron superoxide dismutase [Trametopsis cervina]